MRPTCGFLDVALRAFGMCFVGFQFNVSLHAYKKLSWTQKNDCTYKDFGPFSPELLKDEPGKSILL